MSIDNFDNSAVKQKGFSDGGFDEDEVIRQEFKCYNISWDVEDYFDAFEDLPDELTFYLITNNVSAEELNEEIVEKLTEYTGFCVLSYECDELEKYNLKGDKND